MTQEEKAKRLYQTANADQKYVLESLSPELKESEDERIRKWLTDTIKSVPNDSIEWDVIDKSDVLAWLEKQGEQKLDIEMKSAEESLGIDSETYNKIVDECIYSEQKPAWSEEDEKIAKTIINEFEQCSEWCCANGLTKEDCIAWLKSLRPQNRWKPSDEQMEALEHFVRSIGESGYDDNTKLLYSLLSDLKKLREG